MPDREKVIRALECCEKANNCGNCPYDGECTKRDFALTRDAIALLRSSREPDRAPIMPRARGRVERYYVCGECGAELQHGDAFCSACGRGAVW